MKRSLVFLFAAVIALTACQQEIRTERLSLEEDIPFSEGSQFQLGLRADVEFPISGFDKEALADVRKAIRVACFGDTFADFTDTPEKLGEAWRNWSVEGYKSTNEELLRDMGITEKEAFNLNWNSEVDGAFGEIYRNWVNYNVEQYNYEGGAHGMFGQFPMVFDLRTGERVNWDVFTGKLNTDLLKALLDEYKFDNMGEKVEDIDRDNVFYVDSIEPSQWFSVDEKGLTFYYQPYDIAPYVFGVIDITIPWEEIH